MNYKNLSITEQLLKYAEYCLNDVVIDERTENYISCEKHKQACRRFLNDMNRIKSDPNCPFEWREEEVNKVVNFAKRLKHTKGVLAGTSIDIRSNGWQLFQLGNLYGFWNKKYNRRRFKRYFNEVARKNAKSQLLSIIGGYDMSVIATKNREQAEIYCAGVKREQSKIVFEESKSQLLKSDLRLKFKCKQGEVIHIKTGSTFKPLSAQDGKTGDGTNPSTLIIDEYHQHPTTEFVDLFLGSSRNDSLLAIITTAGVDLKYPCYTVEYQYATGILNGKVIDDEYFTDICEADSKDDFESLSTWQKANPVRCSYERGIEDLESACNKAKESEEETVKFKTKCCDIWVSKKKYGYMDFMKWHKGMIKSFPFETANNPCYIGFDLSSKIDLTSISFVFPHLLGGKDSLGNKIVEYVIFSHSFIANEERLRQKIKSDKQPYDKWVEEGYISLTNTEVVDQTFVMNWVLDKIDEFGLDIKKNVKMFSFDDSNASKFMMDLQHYLETKMSAKKASEKIFNCHQSILSLNEVTKNFRDEVYKGNVKYIKNPVLDMAIKNAVIVSNKDGNIKIDKDAGKNRIDPVDATLFGFKPAQWEDFKGDSSDALDDIYSSWGA